MTGHPSGFTFRYAIRMPNGELYRHPQTQAPVEDFSTPSPMRDMLSMFGLTNSTTAPKPAPPGPAIFDNRKDAERLFEQIRAHAAAFGVTYWGGTVVVQLCTPFTPGDTPEFWGQVQEWLRTQGMDA